MLASWPAALVGVPAAEVSLFHYKSLQAPHLAQKKKNWADSLSLIFLPNTSKHLKTPLILTFPLQSSR